MTVILLGFAFGLACLLGHLVSERRRLEISGPLEQATRASDADVVWADTA